VPYWKKIKSNRIPNIGISIYSDTAAQIQSSLDQELMTVMVKIIIGEIPVDAVDQAQMGTQWRKYTQRTLANTQESNIGLIKVRLINVKTPTF
jgi:hypothetical protein